MDLFSSLKVNFKNLLFNSLLTHCHNDGDFKEYFQTLAFLLQKYRAMFPNIFMIWKRLAPTKLKHT